MKADGLQCRGQFMAETVTFTQCTAANSLCPYGSWLVAAQLVCIHHPLQVHYELCSTDTPQSACVAHMARYCIPGRPLSVRLSKVVYWLMVRLTDWPAAAAAATMNGSMLSVWIGAAPCMVMLLVVTAVVLY